MTDPDRPDWTLILTPVAGDDRPVGRRVARLLKYALRACGLRAVVVRDPTAAELRVLEEILGREGE